MDVTVGTDPALLTSLDAEWRALWEADPHASIFHTPEYARIAWETELGADRDLVLIQVRADGALAGLAPLTIDPDGTLRFLGNAEVTDYLGPLAIPGARDAVADAVIARAATMDGWRQASFLGIAEDSGWADALARAAGAAGLRADAQPHDVCPRIALDGASFDAYLATLPSKLRHEIRRKARKLERETGGFSIRRTERATLRDDLERFFAMHRRSEGAKGKFMHEEMAALFTRLAEAFDDRGWLRLLWLDVDGEPWAATLSFVERGIWNVYNSAYEHTKRDLGPGMVLMGETIRLATEEACTTFDLLRGDEPYKYRFGATDVAVIELTIART